RLKAVHYAPDGAEQTDERRRRTDRREIRHKAFDSLHLATHRDTHHALDALLQARPHNRSAEKVLGGAASPLPHRRRKNGAHRIGWALTDPLVEILERAARPEGLLEIRCGRSQPAQPDHLVEDDRPR